jgi:FAD/FMN-containing dehydrogenase
MDAEVVIPSGVKAAKDAVMGSAPLIPRGMGRCYGDSSLSDTVLSTDRFGRMRSFWERDGLLSCEAGVSLGEIVETFGPRGWFLPVTPGTKFVTVGGAIAADVHGKNHHRDGSFSKHLVEMEVLLGNGEIVTCSREKHEDLFRATCGGMGLLGVVLSATFRLVPVETGWIRQEAIKARDLDEIMKRFEESAGWTYSVAWIDCLAKGSGTGRSILMLGEHAKRNELPRSPDRHGASDGWTTKRVSVPFFFPEVILNRFSAQAFNTAYYGHTPKGRQASSVDCDAFFYPLDKVHHWNRIYGKRGFVQYQFVLPMRNSYEGLKRILRVVSEGDHPPFLTVLKLLGEGTGLLSFPLEGYTLAMDIPIRDGLFPFLDRLDEIVLSEGGRLYLAKDVRMRREMFAAGYPEVGRLREIRKKYGGEGRFESLQSKRVGI